VIDTVCIAPGGQIPALTRGSDVFLAITDGWAARAHEKDGKRQLTALFLPGDLCDPLWLGDGPADSVVALGEVRGIVFDRSFLLSPPHSQCGVLAGHILAEVIRHSHALTRLALVMGRFAAIERVAWLLCELRSRLRAMSHSETIKVPLDHEVVADFTGLTATHVQRALDHLRTAEIATLQNGRLEIGDPTRLARIARIGQPARASAPVTDWPSLVLNAMAAHPV
jgi:CRP-like cAMP-binding protein